MQAKKTSERNMETEIREARDKLLELRAMARQGNPGLRSRQIEKLEIIEQQIDEATSRWRDISWIEARLRAQPGDAAAISTSNFGRPH